jgi:hypothetical protein
MRELGRISSYEDLCRVLRTRCDEFDISFTTLDEAAGLADGHSSKLLAPRSSLTMGRTSLGALLRALGIALIAVEDPEAVSRALPRLHKRKPSGLHRQPVGRVEAP